MAVVMVMAAVMVRMVVLMLSDAEEIDRSEYFPSHPWYSLLPPFKAPSRTSSPPIFPPPQIKLGTLGPRSYQNILY